ncbi:MAG: OmpA family protein [Myxococcales bacterium]|nr:OmpA family protein [Myxococcales bacterium]MCB9668951.1 OmpA family protein [Alphaproteobacteria bacterium]MCB9691278.1 OmpA family protein [Alphaproteobacteria bacterium]
MLAVLASALAQDPTLDLQRFLPTGAAQGFVTVPSARQCPSQGYALEALGQLGGGGFYGVTESGGTVTVEPRATTITALHVRGAYGVTRAVELALQAPLVQAVGGSGIGTGDVRLAASLRPLAEDVLGVVVEPFASFPSGTAGLTRSVVTPGARLAVSKSFGKVHAAGTFGGRYLPVPGWLPQEVGVTHEILFGAGVAWEPSASTHAGLELTGAALGPTLRFANAEGYRDAMHLPIEAVLAGRHAPIPTIGLAGGLAFAVARGVATPAWRLFLGVTLSGSLEEPEPTAWVPPPEPELEPHQGQADRDRDRIPDAWDACPLDPEDYDGFLDHDGCPEPDNDQDGIPDPWDICPVDPELYNGIKDDDGCPDDLRVVLTTDRIHILEQVHFRPGSAALDPISLPVLDAILKTFVEHPEIERVRIEGHTDDTGDPRANLRLSGDRATSVLRWLVEHGVDPGRLEAEGFGPYSPIVPNDSPLGRERNRRVELHVLRVSGEP